MAVCATLNVQAGKLVLDTAFVPPNCPAGEYILFQNADYQSLVNTETNVTNLLNTNITTLANDITNLKSQYAALVAVDPATVGVTYDALSSVFMWGFGIIFTLWFIGYSYSIAKHSVKSL